MDKIKIKAKPAETHVKVQYEGEELSIRELVDRIKMYKRICELWRNKAEKATKVADELKKQIADAQPVRHGRWITVVETNGKEHSKCAACQMELDGLEDAYSFCPHYGSPMTGEAVDLVMQRLEALQDEDD